MTDKKRPKRFVTLSSGNVFADLGLPDAEVLNTKVQLIVETNRIIQEQGLARVAAARRLKISQSKVSALTKYRLEVFSAWQLMSFLAALDRDAHIAVRPKLKSAKTARILVTAA